MLKTERKINKYERPNIDSPSAHFKRITNRPLLTDRDKEIILFIYYSRCVTSSHIAEVFFRYRPDGKENRAYMASCRRRLRVLFRNHIINRFFVDVGAFNGTSEQHVMLDQVGALMVAGWLNVPMSDIKWKKDQNDVRLPYLQHTVEINDVGNLIRQKARLLQHSLPVWKVEAHNFHQFGDYRFCPDAYFQYFSGNKGFHGFLEHHRGTMSAYQFRVEKVPKYREFLLSGEYEKHYKSFPFVFVTCFDWDTVMELKDAVEKEDTGGVIWHFTTIDSMERGWMQNIWIKAGSDRPISLMEYLM